MVGEYRESLTALLQASTGGCQDARERLWQRVYDELRSMAAGMMAREAPGHTLQPTALVNQAFIRLFGGDPRPDHNPDRAYFFGAAAQAMRRILIEHARKRSTRANNDDGFILDTLAIAATSQSVDSSSLDALDEALDELEQQHPDAWNVIMHRFFAGLTVDDTAAALSLSPRTVNRLWTFGRTWLYDRVLRKLQRE